jgi:ribonuclease PH
MARNDGREVNVFRAVEMVPGFHRNAEGSVLYKAGGTVVLCAASVDDSQPKWMDEKDGGWLTAEYQMHPRANPQRRENREGRGRPPKGRTQEIQRLVGRAMRSALDLKKLGPRTITIDCDVLEADGGTRTASITAAFVATALALHGMGLAGIIQDQVAAISVGHVGGDVLVDLDYSEDSTARVDMNLVATRGGDLVEVQATAEGVAITRDTFNSMVDAGLVAIKQLCELQVKTLQAADVDLSVLMKRN